MPTAVKIPCQASARGPMWTSGSKGIWIIGPGAARLAAVALLVLLAGAAVAGLVAPDLVPGRGSLPSARGRAATLSSGGRGREGGGPSGRRAREAARAGGPLRGALDALLLPLLVLLDGLHAHAQDHLRRRRGDARVHLLPVAVRFALVRH